MRLSILLLLSLGHLVVDLTQGGLPFLLPFFKEAFGLSYTAVGVVVLLSNLSSSIVQPLFGYWSDRRSLRWLLPTGCLLAGTGIGLAGFAPGYAPLLALVVLSGLGVAAYHPEASKVARRASGRYRATSMAVFSVGGNLGFGLGPLLAAYGYARAGLAGSLTFVWPAVAMFLLLCLLLPRIRGLGSPEALSPAGAVASGPGQEATAATVANPSAGSAAAAERRGNLPYGYAPVLALIAIVVLRSWVHAGLTNYIPLYYVTYLGGSETLARDLQTVFLLSGALGTLVGAPLADRWGLKTLVTLSMAAQVPLIYFFPAAHGFWLHLMLAASGFLVISTFAVTVVLGQELLPRHVGLASGLMLGFGIGTGGLGVTVMGAVADAWGVPVALSLLSFLPALAVALTHFLPRLADAGERSAGKHL